MPERDPPSGPTPEDVVEAARAAAPATPPAPAPAPLPAVAEVTAEVTPARPVERPGVVVAGQRIEFAQVGMLIAAALAGVVIANVVLTPLGVSLESIEVRDLRINEATCRTSLVAAEGRIGRMEAQIAEQARRLERAETQIAEAKTAVQDIARACAIGSQP